MTLDSSLSAHACWDDYSFGEGKIWTRRHFYKESHCAMESISLALVYSAQKRRLIVWLPHWLAIILHKCQGLKLSTTRGAAIKIVFGQPRKLEVNLHDLAEHLPTPRPRIHLGGNVFSFFFTNESD